VINDPNVITVQRELPRAQALLASIYQCDYAGYFQAVRIYTAMCVCVFVFPCAFLLKSPYVSARASACMSW
jgi:hypothetical protein